LSWQAIRPFSPRTFRAVLSGFGPPALLKEIRPRVARFVGRIRHSMVKRQIMNTLTVSEIRVEHQAPRTAERFHSLDALRAFALLLGVVFHSILAYVLPPGIWAVGTTESPTPLLWFVYYSHCFRMEVFFLLAGFFARLVIEKRGVASFLRDRAKRILLVFVVALYPMKLLLSSVWVSGGLKTGWLKLPPDAAGLPPWQLAIGGFGMESWPNINLTHLWFLYYLACVSGLFIVAQWLTLKWIVRSTNLPRTIDAAFRRVTSSWLAPLLLALLSTPVLAMMAGPDVDTPDKSLAWNYPVLLLYGMYFCFGWWLHRQADLLGVLARRWKLLLPLSLGVSLVASIGVGFRISAEPSTALRWATSFGTSLTMSLAVLGWLGLFVRLFSRSSVWARYLADSSYWVYLAHLPLVVALQVSLSAWEVPWWLKLLAVNGIAFAILLTTYHLCVRFTWIGAWLNGRRAEHLKGR
jgi:peptidoglycan/LPS O-acetylase OafA/YrhL